MTATRNVEAALAAIARQDGNLRAFLTVDAAGARVTATELDRSSRRPRPLHGVPVAIKDLTDTAGLRTTYGSLLFEDHVPTVDDLIVARLRSAGAVIVGKTMTPEFGFGAICANKLGGPTANPWDMSLTSGGSSGGAAAAVAAGMVPLAHGTDFGGSVRTPASFCGVCSIRPTPGVLPNPKRALGYDMLATTGYVAREVAMLESAITATAGPDPADPLSRPPGRAPKLPERLCIATTEDFGHAPVSREVRARFSEAMQALAANGVSMSAAHPDCADAVAIFRTLRPSLIAHAFGPLAEKHGDALTETVRWWIAQAGAITTQQYLAAEAARTALARRFVSFFDRFEMLIAPAASVLPWPNSIPDVTEIDGRLLDTIADYLAITFIVSLAGCPVVTLPAPLGNHRLPFGVQLIGPPGADMKLLGIARRIEQSAGFRFVRPPAFRSESDPT